jgi:hypothetical protein
MHEHPGGGAAAVTVTRVAGSALEFRVASESTEGKPYAVDVATGRCDCPVGRRGWPCKHLQAALAFLGEENVVNNGKATTKAPTVLKLGYPMGVAASALQKEIRRGDTEAAVYWALLLYDKASYYAWKRVLITAAEDIGIAAPEAVQQVCALAGAWAQCKANAFYVSPHHLVLAVMLLCRAPKSTEVNDLMEWTQERIKAGEKLPVLEEYLDPHTAEGKAAGKGWDTWFRSRHVTFGMPVNEYTRRLWATHPEWRPEEYRGDDA